jgi:hypothetical protein
LGSKQDKEIKSISDFADALRPLSLKVPSDWYDSEDAISTIDRSSSPLIPNHTTSDGIPFLSLNSDDLLSDDIYDHIFSPDCENPTYPKLSNDEKAVEILQFMKNQFPQFSMQDLLSSIFSSDLGSIKNYTTKYLEQGGRMDLLDLLVGKNLHHDEALSVWIMEKAAQICQREFSQLTDRASRGAHYADAEFF